MLLEGLREELSTSKSNHKESEERVTKLERENNALEERLRQQASEMDLKIEELESQIESMST